ncbi:MAG: hypothetical protein HXY50_08240 [Ignavibacteriaceae bacterium]|nr:hypothetical protein [Ignavibacteriaceae bacterium]
MKYEKEIKLLRLFNEKVGKLEKLAILKNIKNVGFEVKTTYKRNKRVEKEKRFGPNSKSIDAFVLTIRFFVRDRDGISINKINKLYSSLPLSKILIEKVSETELRVNQYLSDHIGYTVDNYTFTRCDAFEIILFGSLAHANANDKRRKQYESIENNVLAYEVVYNSFTRTLIFLLNKIKIISATNKKAILELENITV